MSELVNGRVMAPPMLYLLKGPDAIPDIINLKGLQVAGVAHKQGELLLVKETKLGLQD